MGYTSGPHLGSGATGMTPTDNTSHLTVSHDTLGVIALVDLQDMDLADMYYDNTTADPGLAADLNAIVAVDNDWYGVAMDSDSGAEILALAAWLETKKKIGVVQSMDSNIPDSAAIDDIASQMELAAYTRTWGLFSRNVNNDYRCAAWLSKEIVKQPGSSTWAHKTLAGITADNLKSGWETTINNKKWSHYTAVGGRNVTFESMTPAGEFADIIHFIDWLHARVQESVWDVLASNDKIPFTDRGVELVASAIRQILRQGVQVGGLKGDPAPTVTFPRVADVSTANRANRILPDGKFTAELAGAIHKLVIRGKVSV